MCDWLFVFILGYFKQFCLPNHLHLSTFSHFSLDLPSIFGDNLFCRLLSSYRRRRVHIEDHHFMWPSRAGFYLQFHFVDCKNFHKQIFCRKNSLLSQRGSSSRCCIGRCKCEDRAMRNRVLYFKKGMMI